MNNPLDDARQNPFDVAGAAARQLLDAAGVSKIDIALTLGSGWAKAADFFGETLANINASEITGFSAPVVPGHVSTLRVIRLESGKIALVLGARTHYYEGHGVRRVVHGVRTASAAGAKIMVLTNGSGGIKEHWTNGTPVLISDHINLTADSPIEGANFVDLTDLYSKRLRELAHSVDPTLDEGVYVQLRGPHYETPAEVQMCKAIGGHLVGMSTALEAIAARERGLEVLGLSLMTNLAAGIQTTPLNHEEVLAAGVAAEPRISALLSQIVNRL
jgi:purine-nucleoside phosphorylase